jgi:hypothetical protein
MTTEEFNATQAPVSFKKKKKKKKRDKAAFRERVPEADVGEAEGKAMESGDAAADGAADGLGALGALEPSAAVTTQRSRRRGAGGTASASVRLQAQQHERLGAYEQAVGKAARASDDAFAASEAELQRRLRNLSQRTEGVADPVGTGTGTGAGGGDAAEGGMLSSARVAQLVEERRVAAEAGKSTGMTECKSNAADDDNHNHNNHNNNNQDNGDKDNGDNAGASGHSDSDKVVFSTTTAFTARLQARLQEKERARMQAASQTAAMEAAAAPSRTPGEPASDSEGEAVAVAGDAHVRSEQWGWAEASEGSMDVAGASSSSSSSASQVALAANGHLLGDEEDPDVDFLGAGAGAGATALASAGAAGSLAGALARLRETGELRRSELLVGRATDRRDAPPAAAAAAAPAPLPSSSSSSSSTSTASEFKFSRGLDADGNPIVDLDYRDADGRKLTQKEAFRQV